MNISTFINIASNLPPHIAILMRASTGTGKSAVVSQIAKENLKLPLIDVRGSLMSEGDVGGYPDIEGMKENGVMTFCMPAWFVRACNEPVVLFLDELNRSLPTVQQSFFQLVLDRQLGNDKEGNPYNIHPETRIFAAINHGSEYDVNEMDPALLRRFWVTDIEASKDDWISWAKENGIDEFIIEFLNLRSKHLAPDLSTAEPGKVFPTPASWARFDETLKYANINIEDYLGKTNTTIYNIATGFIGVETSIEFSDFVKKYKVHVTPEELLASYTDVKDKLDKMSNDRINALIERLGEHAKINNWTLSQGDNAAKLGKSISHEMLVHFWSVISGTKNLESIKSFHHYIGDYLVKIVNNSQNLSK